MYLAGQLKSVFSDNLEGWAGEGGEGGGYGGRGHTCAYD